MFSDQSQSFSLCRFTHYDTHPITSVEPQDCRYLIYLISYPKVTRFITYIQIFLPLTQYFYVADNARDAVLLHVSAASERQEQRNKTGAMTKTTGHCRLNSH